MDDPRCFVLFRFAKKHEAKRRGLIRTYNLLTPSVFVSYVLIKGKMDYVRSVLGIPDRVMPLNVIAVGNPVGVEKPKDKFDPGNIHWNKW